MKTFGEISIGTLFIVDSEELFIKIKPIDVVITGGEVRDNIPFERNIVIIRSFDPMKVGGSGYLPDDYEIFTVVETDAVICQKDKKIMPKRTSYTIQDGQVKIENGDLECVNLNNPRGIEITHPDGTVEVIEGIHKLYAPRATIKNLYM